MSSLQTNDTSESKQTNEVPLSSSIDPTNLHLINICNYAYGLCIGAGIGDSLGSYLEFSNGNSLSEVIDHAMTMPGGGTWGSRVKSGQVTDDTELAISLCRGLIQIIDENNPKTDHIFDSIYIAKEYEKWYDSNPFDIGGCTSTTISEAPVIQRMKNAASQYNTMMQSQFKSSGNLANGSLMRCMPLIVYGYKLNDKHLYNIMAEDSSLTHANIVIYITNTAYAIAAKYLLVTHDDIPDEQDNSDEKTDEKTDEKNDNDNDNDSNRNIDAFLMSEKWLKQGIFTSLGKKDNEYYKEVYEWLMDCKQDDISKLHKATKFIGFLKIAFQRAFYHLWNGSDFKTAMRVTISEGGDTDTNCCIVGGLIGAYWGLNKIPNEFVDSVMNCIPYNTKRDNMFQAKLYKIGEYIETLVKNAPDNVEVKVCEVTQQDIEHANSQLDILAEI